jgi:hypothetical protein
MTVPMFAKLYAEKMNTCTILYSELLVTAGGAGGDTAAASAERAKTWMHCCNAVS